MRRDGLRFCVSAAVLCPFRRLRAERLLATLLIVALADIASAGNPDWKFTRCLQKRYGLVIGFWHNGVRHCAGLRMSKAAPSAEAANSVSY